MASETSSEIEQITAHRNEMEALLKTFMEDNSSLKRKLEHALLENEKLSSNDYKAKYETLKATVEPFKEQLEYYEMERRLLKDQVGSDPCAKLSTYAYFFFVMSRTKPPRRS